ncbi:Efr3-like protein [Thalictrum thalictroides]|uniref:Efr3-like protein n=1 Tax=Thalictrum thalictroides TaxID=46969 RepID=A0A7J6V1F8_THATH|nr:Efr3-like protein [Thalictrum thalictroides]
MGFMSRKVFPACGHMCVCCPALRTRSRQPVKRYKKLLADIFPKSPDDSPHDRKLVKLCEYAFKNPFRIPKIAAHLEQRIYKELRNDHIKYIIIAMEAYNKLLLVCKQQMPYFAMSLFNVVVELLDNTKQDSLRILGCQTLTRFIYSQPDGTYARNIEILVPKLCKMACETGDEHSKRCLKASSLQCISSLIWFMAEFLYIFSGFDDIVHVTLDNYLQDAHVVDDAENGEAHHNWVDEVVRSECRGAGSPSDIIIRPRPEKKDPSLLTREEIDAPIVWAQICIQKMAELAKESTTMRQVLDPMFIYFDTRRHWVPQQGLAKVVLSDMLYFMEGSGNEQSILSAIIRHLEHKNIAHDPLVKANIVKVVAALARQLRSEAIVVETGIMSDLCRHLKKCLQASVLSTGEQHADLNAMLRKSIEDCLLEMAKGVDDVQQLFDMMALTLEKPTPVGVTARVTVQSMLILAHIISLASSCSHSQQDFPESLLLQLLKTMIHRDAEARIVAHQIFSVLLVSTFNHPDESMRCQSRSTPVFASAAALLEKLRREKDGNKVDKHGNHVQYDYKEKEWRQGWILKRSPTFCKLTSIIDRTVWLPVSADTEPYIVKLSEDQICHLLSAFWIQAALPDNMPSNFEAISHSFNLTVISSHLRIPNYAVVRFFQLPLSLRSISLDPNYGMLPPSCKRSLFVLATAMLMSAAKVYHIINLCDFLKSSVSYDVDPYVEIGDDQQLYVKSQADVKEYRSATDHQTALYALSELREGIHESDKAVLDLIVQSLSGIVELDKDELTTQLSAGFRPDDSLIFGPQSWHDVDHLQALSIPKESLSFDGDFLASGTNEDDTISDSSVSGLSCVIPRVSASSAHVISVGQLLQSAFEEACQVAGTAVSTSPLPYSAMTYHCEALGTCAMKNLSNWLNHEAHEAKSADQLVLTLPITSDVTGPRQEGGISTEPWLAMRLPPASPFDNFLRAVNRRGAPFSPSVMSSSRG